MIKEEETPAMIPTTIAGMMKEALFVRLRRSLLELGEKFNFLFSAVCNLEM